MVDPVITQSLFILGLPLLSYVLTFFFGEKLPRRGDFIGIGLVGISLALSIKIFVQFWGVGDPAFQIQHTWTWFTIDRFHVDAGVLVDGMTAIMLVVVTLISFLVHLFSSGYMAGDRRYARYFAFLGFFTFSMLGIVLANNVFFLYVFWELVGLASYLLIGFFFHKTSAANANKKAFLVNRVGDFGFWLGILIFFTAVGSFSYQDLFAGVQSGALSGGLLTAAGVLLFMGCIGKSAQVPLHIWLPDAMEGPTPVSALIHAATMVAAGVYMIARLFPLFTPDALLVITYVGAITALLAASIAVVQTDIKKGLAYSTISQLGYMVMAVGVGGVMAGMFHLTTHACFKALLFLGSGAVIHAMHHEQDMRQMGGLRHKLPITFITFLIATIAISGVPPFAGFFSKDAILGAALVFAMEHPAHWVPFAMALFAAGLTSFYMFRILFLTFTGKPRNQEKYDHAHEVSFSMAAPLVVLAALSIVVGGLTLDGANWFARFVSPNSAPAAHAAMVIEHGIPVTPELMDHGQGATEQLEAESTTGPSWEMERADAVGGAAAETPAAGGEEVLVVEEVEEAEGVHGLEVAEEMQPREEAGEEAHSAEGAGGEEHGGHDVHHAAHIYAMYSSIFVAGLGILLSWLIYKRRILDTAKLQAEYHGLYELLANKYWFDEIYSATVIRWTLIKADAIAAFDKWIVDGVVNWVGYLTKVHAWFVGGFDNKVVDGFVNGSGYLMRGFGSALRNVQTGRIQNYLLGLITGLVILILVYRVAWPS
jgi:NADH-quinone oxidoreductase subunit L